MLFFLLLVRTPATVPDGAGGYVPFTNSRVMPDGSLRPYDPIIDGTVAYGPYPSIVAMPGAPTDYPDLVEGPPPAPDYVYPEDYAGWKKLLRRSHGGTIGRKWRITRVTTRTGNLLVQIMKSAG